MLLKSNCFVFSYFVIAYTSTETVRFLFSLLGKGKAITANRRMDEHDKQTSWRGNWCVWTTSWNGKLKLSLNHHMEILSRSYLNSTFSSYRIKSFFTVLNNKLYRPEDKDKIFRIQILVKMMLTITIMTTLKMVMVTWSGYLTLV